VAGFSIEELGALVRRRRADDTISKAIRQIPRVDLIMVHTIGMLPVGEDAAECFYRMVDARYEKRSRMLNTDAAQGHGARFFAVARLKPSGRVTASWRPASVSSVSTPRASAPYLAGISTELALGTTNDEPT
jgi:IstB-like ATP binding protein